MVYGFVLYTFEIKILRDLLKDNHSFVATSENETIRMENDELVEYIIPDDVYEKTKNEITYEMPTTDSYEKHPEAFQLTKKVTK